MCRSAVSSLPDSMSALRSLRELDLTNCAVLTLRPDDLSALSSLDQLTLLGCAPRRECTCTNQPASLSQQAIACSVGAEEQNEMMEDGVWSSDRDEGEGGEADSGSEALE